jgi:hypothetical protein
VGERERISAPPNRTARPASPPQFAPPNRKSLSTPPSFPVSVSRRFPPPPSSRAGSNPIVSTRSRSPGSVPLSPSIVETRFLLNSDACVGPLSPSLYSGGPLFRYVSAVLDFAGGARHSWGFVTPYRSIRFFSLPALLEALERDRLSFPFEHASAFVSYTRFELGI